VGFHEGLEMRLNTTLEVENMILQTVLVYHLLQRFPKRSSKEDKPEIGSMIYRNC